jgi:hypothetical protein
MECCVIIFFVWREVDFFLEGFGLLLLRGLGCRHLKFKLYKRSDRSEIKFLKSTLLYLL